MLCPDVLAASITAVSIGLAKDRSDEEIALIASIFMQIGDTITTISAARQLNQKCCPQEENETDPAAVNDQTTP